MQSIKHLFALHNSGANQPEQSHGLDVRGQSAIIYLTFANRGAKRNQKETSLHHGGFCEKLFYARRSFDVHMLLLTFLVCKQFGNLVGPTDLGSRFLLEYIDPCSASLAN